jgi:hypothetical protein
MGVLASLLTRRRLEEEDEDEEEDEAQMEEGPVQGLHERQLHHPKARQAAV